MRRLLLALFVLLSCAVSALAGTSNGYVTVAPIASSFCSFSPAVSTSLTTGCTTIPTGSLCAYITVVGQNVNWRDDGSAATASVGSGGQQLLVNDHLWTCGNLAGLRFIQQAATTTVSVSFYK